MKTPTQIIESWLSSVFKQIGVPDSAMPDKDYIVGYIKEKYIESDPTKSDEENYRKFTHLTLAFNAFAHGRLDHNLKLVGKFSPLFIEKVNTAYKAIQNPNTVTEAPEPSKEEKRRLNFEADYKGVINAFEYFKINKKFHQNTTEIRLRDYYNFLYKLNIIAPEQSERDEIRKQAEAIYKKRLMDYKEDARQLSNPKEHSRLDGLLKNFTETLKGKMGKLNVSDISKAIYLKKYFSALLFSEMDLKEIINQKLK
jgi:hypothetical protein